MENQNTTPTKGFNPTWVYVPIILLLGGLVTYLLLDRNKMNDKNEELNEQVSSVSNNKASVETEYNAALARLDKMKGESVQSDSLLSARNEEVEDLKLKIKTILSKENASAAEISQANSMITQLNKKITSFQEQIVSLKKENIQLTEEKRQLTEEKNELTNRNDVVLKEKENLNEEKKQTQTKLEKTVETASILHASGFKLEAINMKRNLLGKEKEQETGRAKKADLMRITFDLDANRISESGEKMIYICVTDPSGKIATASNSGKIKLADGSEKEFTSVKTIAYKKGENVNDISTDWKPSTDFVSGIYKVEIYHMGYRIGSEMVTLK
jgi:predicted nuclease with TOPRIM domain